ncbi:Protein of unknown function [Mesorhizobium albiziae]|uniref:DUF2380 domain-containing protein n=1 Tax=Neomesorhizobium albiziae TaxID=335020 RepID=A0A1I3Z7X6_9HYPH|nr:DUF2380 domain-containing protein [Mesorhizobium albiziae]GLS32056.1 hypothetical protein GCM10007937_37660 [Mesorhizobium albiziae]SFK40133.1 Protein of unknown function [Mesorhizobium albiziae]
MDSRVLPDGRNQAPARAWRTALAWTIATIFVLFAVSSPKAETRENRPSLALAGFFLVDSSGELRDQKAEHAARLQRFDDILHEELSKSGRFTLADMECPEPRCTRETLTLDQLAGYARDAGARFVAVGAVEKMSTLVLWSRLEVYEVSTRKLVFNSLLTFRGDNDEAWRRAARYAARELIRSVSKP